ncbi:hypothetical protein C1T31_11410 [Hanstruepera neustonica]|uniref:Uncharacterized protein n=1 Tax=Hanstruepera neustonica TaxID=1445657 RepID=A0A2K1DWH8_9FLAO|nr:hypothetical protein [Hanstruepera neustonica]PNQ72396.1 hypothetical protein C1T31_11410 [Hanstruepera neustonica]
MKFLTVLFFLFALQINAQDIPKYNVYFDENDQAIEITDYYKKCSAFLLHCMSKTKDSITINYMYELNKFGQLDSIENNQIRKLLKRDTKNPNIDKSPVIIVFRDTLYGFEGLKQRYDTYVKRVTINDTIREILPFNLTKNKYFDARKKYDNNQKKMC